MYQQQYHVAKTSGTFADTLAAFGLARVLRAVLQLRPRERRDRLAQHRVVLRDMGWAYGIDLPTPLVEQWIDECPFIGDLAPFIMLPAKPKRGTKGAVPDEDGGGNNIEVSRRVAYDDAWRNIRAIQAILKQRRERKAPLKSDEFQDLLDTLREPGQDEVLLVGDYRMQVAGIHNQAVLQWQQTRDYQAANLRAILSICSGVPVDEVAKPWATAVPVAGVKKNLTCSQLFNPSMGKGQNRPKADQLVMGNMDEFWLLVYLKVVGLHATAASRQVRKEDSRKVYVLLPGELSLAWHQDVFDAFQRALPSSTSVRLDVLASLAYARCWLENTTLGQFPTESGGAEHVNGLAVATYRLLSRNSYTMINMATLGLPPWLRHTPSPQAKLTPRDVNVLKGVIDEQRRIVERLREDRNAEYNLLVSYREFVTGHQFDAFFDFCAGYGEHVLRMLEETDRVRQVSARAIDELIRRMDIPMQEGGRLDVTEFASNSESHPGFHRIARAIYASTVRPQREKAKHRRDSRSPKPVFEVRYGLASKLRRKTDRNADFIQELAEFIQVYNAETVQQFEHDADDRSLAEPRYRRPIVQASDIDDVLNLVERCGAPLVCNLLVAYGYASRGKQPASVQVGADLQAGETADDADQEATIDEEMEESLA